jgi:hypothetical protein
VAATALETLPEATLLPAEYSLDRCVASYEAVLRRRVGH